MAQEFSFTVGQLKELLEGFDDDQQVRFTYSANDYWSTQLAVAPSEDTEIGVIEYSEYHRCEKVVSDEKIDDTDEDQKTDIVLISLQRAY